MLQCLNFGSSGGQAFLLFLDRLQLILVQLFVLGIEIIREAKSVNDSVASLNLDLVLSDLLLVCELLFQVTVEFEQVHLQVTHTGKQFVEGDDEDEVFVTLIDKNSVVFTTFLLVLAVSDLLHDCLDSILIQRAGSTTDTSVEVINGLHDSGITIVLGIRAIAELEDTVHDALNLSVLREFTLDEALSLFEGLLLVTASLKVLVSGVSKLGLTILKSEFVSLHGLVFGDQGLDLLVMVINLSSLSIGLLGNLYI